jgi:glycosyltransferase involved in cell wall biosynthesis
VNSVKVSVVMTVYNGAKTVRETVASVLSQTMPDFEFLIVDNASTDATIDIIKGFNDPRVKLHPQSVNQGQSKALVLGMSLATAPYIARIDADDVCMPNRLARQTAYLDLHPECALVGSWHDEIDDEGHYLKTTRYPTTADVLRANLLSDGGLTHRALCHPSVCFRKTAYDTVGGYNPEIKYAQDYELWARFVEKYPVANIPEVLLHYRASRGSTSNRFRPEMEQELDRIQHARLKRLWPEISERTKDALCALLRNTPPPAGWSAMQLWDAFREYWNRTIPPDSGVCPERIFGYYVPMLLRCQTPGAWTLSAMILAKQPTLLVDKKFIKNIVKRIL